MQTTDQLIKWKQVPLKNSADGLKPKRNTPCPCGSGRKFKRCCMIQGTNGFIWYPVI